MELPDYSIEIKIMFITSKMGCKDRKVIGRESVTTPAGTFDCYVIEETMTAKAMMVNEKTRQVSAGVVVCQGCGPGQTTDLRQEKTHRHYSAHRHPLTIHEKTDIISR